MQKLIDDIMEFQTSTFPTSNAISKLHHLAKEVTELITELENMGTVYSEEDVEMEYADCFLLLFGSAAIKGMTAEDIERVIRKKLEINKKRKWGQPDANGVVLHVKE